MASISDFVVNQDPKTTSNYYTALGVHPEYLNHYKRWEFLIKSYLGGYEFKMGQYLTRYVYESDRDYLKRLQTTPYDNHVKAITHIYNSFIYRNPIRRDFGNIAETPELEAFLNDADLEGRTFDSVMRDVNAMSTVYGHVLCLIDKPKSQAMTRAEELNQNIRPYINIFTPENILDWEFQRTPSGMYELSYLKLLEVEYRANGANERYYVRKFTPETITLEQYKPEKPTTQFILEQMPNELGRIPAVFVYANRSPVRGIGVSDIGDCADMAAAIHTELSEIEQGIRLSIHPSIVATPDTDLNAGAGAIIRIPPETDSGLRPYLLQSNGQNIDSIIQSIEQKVGMIDRMAMMSGIRSVQTRQQSGIAMQTEYTLLDSKLTEKAKNLEVAEEQMWRLFALWQGTVFDGKITYPVQFHIRDKNLDMDILEKAARTNPADPMVKQLIDDKIKETLVRDPYELAEMFEKYTITNEAEEYEKSSEPNDQTTLPDQIDGNLLQHIKEMIASGASDADILAMHPELTKINNQ